MAKDEKIDDRISVAQCKKAVEALYAHVNKVAAKKADTQLLPDAEPSFWLTIALKKQPQGNGLKVFRIPVAHPIVDPRKESVCLITKDPQRTYKDLLADNNIHFIHKVVGIEKLKGKFKAFDARRLLLKQHALFLADDRVIPLLPKLLGSKFFNAKKQPLPVTITRKNLKGELERAISSTYMPGIRGTSLSIKVGRLSQKPAHVLDNLKTALPAVVARVNGGWDNIQSLGIKTGNSINLPIWSCTLDDEDGGRWAGLTAEDEEEEDEDMDGNDDIDEEEEDEAIDSGDDADEDVDMEGDDEKSDSPAMVQQMKTKGRKRAADAVEDNVETEKPKKKSKSSNEAKPNTGKTLAAAVVDAPLKSKKSKAPIPSSTGDTLSALPNSLPKSKPKKLPAPEAPTPVNTPSTIKKMATVVTKDNTAAPETPTVKKGKKATSVAEDMVKPVVASDSGSVKKSKKAKASGYEPVPIPNPSEKKRAVATQQEVVPLETEGISTSKEIPKKKKKQSVGADGAEDILSAAANIVAESQGAELSQKHEKEDKPISAKVEKEGSKKKEKKQKKDKKEGDGVSEVEDRVVVEKTTKEKKEKEKKSKGIDVSSAGDALVVDSTPVADVSPLDSSEKKKKKDKKGKVAEEQVPTVSKDELKQKKSEAPGEKKKSKVVKTKGGKSVKDSLLGKKVV